MSKETGVGRFRPSLPSVSVSVLAFVLQMGELFGPAWAQNAKIIDPTQTRDWALGAIGHAQRMRTYKDIDHGTQSTTIRAAGSEASSLTAQRSRPTTRSSRTWAATDAPASRAISPRMAGA